MVGFNRGLLTGVSSPQWTVDIGPKTQVSTNTVLTMDCDSRVSIRLHESQMRKELSPCFVTQSSAHHGQHDVLAMIGMLT